jgi:hypothetical protein
MQKKPSTPTRYVRPVIYIVTVSVTIVKSKEILLLLTRSSILRTTLATSWMRARADGRRIFSPSCLWVSNSSINSAFSSGLSASYSSWYSSWRVCSLVEFPSVATLQFHVSIWHSNNNGMDKKTFAQLSSL